MVVALIIGMITVAATTTNLQQANAVVKYSYQQFRSWDAFVNSRQEDTPFILPFP